MTDPLGRIAERRHIARTVPCPICDQPAGLECRRIEGKRQTLPVRVHWARFAVATATCPYVLGYAAAKSGRLIMPEGLSSDDQVAWLEGATFAVNGHRTGEPGDLV